jgi:cytochrome c oxidase subunit 3
MSENEKIANPVNPYLSGIAGRCPRCGRGGLFRGFLTLAGSCDHCGLDYGFADSGDGPAVFVILLAGFLIVGLALWLEISYGPPLWLHLALWIPFSLVLCPLLLRAFKGLLINLQYRHNAHEGGLDNG